MVMAYVYLVVLGLIYITALFVEAMEQKHMYVLITSYI